MLATRIYYYNSPQPSRLAALSGDEGDKETLDFQ